MAALTIALSLIVHTDTDKSSSNPRGHAEWSAASNLRSCLQSAVAERLRASGV